MWSTLGEIIPGALARFGLSGPDQAQQIKSEWERITREFFGEKIAQHCRAISFSRNTITVFADSSLIANEIHLRRIPLLVLLKQAIPTASIEHIKIVVAQKSEKGRIHNA